MATAGKGAAKPKRPILVTDAVVPVNELLIQAGDPYKLLLAEPCLPSTTHKKNCSHNPYCLFCLGEGSSGGSLTSASNHTIWSNKPPQLAALGMDPLLNRRDPSIAPAGLVNHGATCYANSLLQVLVRNTEFRAGINAWRPPPHLESEYRRFSPGNMDPPSNPKSLRIGNLGVSPDALRQQQQQWQLQLQQGSASGGAGGASSSSIAGGSAVGSAGALVRLPYSYRPSLAYFRRSCNGSDKIPGERVSDADCADMAALQRMFAHLQLSTSKSYNPADFIRMFAIDPSTQQDVQEFWSVLMSHFENILQQSTHLPPPLQNLIGTMFKGKRKSTVFCSCCGKESAGVEEAFIDLQCTIAGFPTLEESLASQMQRDELVEDNQYECYHCGSVKRDATRHTQLTLLPQVLNLQLMRFDVSSTGLLFLC